MIAVPVLLLLPEVPPALYNRPGRDRAADLEIMFDVIPAGGSSRKIAVEIFRPEIERFFVCDTHWQDRDPCVLSGWGHRDRDHIILAVHKRPVAHPGAVGIFHADNIHGYVNSCADEMAGQGF